MLKTGNPRDDKIVQNIYDHGQAQIFRFWDELDSSQQNGLLEQVRTLDFDLLALQKTVLSGKGGVRGEEQGLDPAPFIPLPSDEQQHARMDEAKKIGGEAIRAGKTAAFLVAGGQGTRLGFNGPKGCYPIGPKSGKTLFQMHAEKILAASRKYETTIPWAIMTSEINDTATRAFFEENKYFGLTATDIRFFPQRMIPALTAEGQIILDRKDHIFMNPNGHGGSLLALMESGTVDHYKARGIEILSYFQVDNVLINIIDPVFIGYHIQEKAEMSSKMVRKSDPYEKVGLFGIRKGKMKVIEYSDMPVEKMEALNPDGSLKYKAGSIAIHLINTAFIENEIRDGFKLPYHLAHKKVPVLDNAGTLVDPAEPNAYKFETFVFDALSDTTSSVIMEVAREEEFSPVKNADGIDSAVSAKKDISNYYARWLEAAGIDVERDQRGDVKGAVEISPLFAVDKAEFLTKSTGLELRSVTDLYID